jgi:hypothetical protein
LLNEGGRSILFEAESGVGLSVQVLVDCTALEIGGVVAITENTEDCTRTVLAVTMECQIFCVTIALAVTALGNLSFVPWRFKCDFTLLKEFNIEYILIVRSRLQVDKKHGEW